MKNKGLTASQLLTALADELIATDSVDWFELAEWYGRGGGRIYQRALELVANVSSVELAEMAVVHNFLHGDWVHGNDAWIVGDTPAHRSEAIGATAVVHEVSQRLRERPVWPHDCFECTFIRHTGKLHDQDDAELRTTLGRGGKFEVVDLYLHPEQGRPKRIKARSGERMIVGELRFGLQPGQSWGAYEFCEANVNPYLRLALKSANL